MSQTANGNPNQEIEKARRTFEDAKKQVEQSQIEYKRLRYFVILAVVTPPLALLYHWVAALLTLTTWVSFWLVGWYINYFYRRESLARMHTAEDALRRLEKAQIEAQS